MNDPTFVINISNTIAIGQDIQQRKTTYSCRNSVDRPKQRLFSLNKNKVVPIFDNPKQEPPYMLSLTQLSDFNDQSIWEDQKLPLTPEFVLDNFSHYLIKCDREEIKYFTQIYFIGHKANKEQHVKTRYSKNESSDFIIVQNDHIGYRYEIIDLLGKGSFGQVVKCIDHKNGTMCAVKVIKNSRRYHEQALIEIKILKHIQMVDQNQQSNAVISSEYFQFRSHICIVFELLSHNLYELLRSNQFIGLPLDVIRRIAIQILQTLAFLRRHKIIHCDLKPENILLKQPAKSGIKVIDFGSSCFNEDPLYNYIQSRFYRAPEVIMGHNYDTQIDMWSFGCILIEMERGTPIFAGENEEEQISLIFELMGAPPILYLEKCLKKSLYFTEDNKLKLKPNSKGKVLIPGTKSVFDYVLSGDTAFSLFVQECFGNWDKRIYPEEALVHPWILAGLPEQVKQQHLQQMNELWPHLKIQEPKGKVSNDLSALIQKQLIKKDEIKIRSNVVKKFQ